MRPPSLHTTLNCKVYGENSITSGLFQIVLVAMKIVCSLGTISKYKQVHYVLGFLRDFHDQYSGVRSQMMLMDLIPSVNKNFLHTLSKREANA